LSHYEIIHPPEPSASCLPWRAREEKIHNSSRLAQPGGGHQDLISESTMENLPFQDMNEIYKPNSKFCIFDKPRLYDHTMRMAVWCII